VISYLEIYNEQINDLFDKDGMNLKMSGEGKVLGLREQEIQSFEDAMILLSYGEENRAYRDTGINERSSRSHTIFRIQMR
jgi:centromeric protein E